MVGNVFEVELQLGLKLAELGPYLAVEGPFGGPHHDGRAPLPRIAKGAQAVLAADGDEQPDRPHVGQREPELGLESAIAVSTAEAATQPLRCRPGDGSFPGTGCLSKQGLQLGELSRSCSSPVIANQTADRTEQQP